MSKRKSDHAFVITCNPGYGFGLIATMKAQNYFGTDADWEIGYEGFSEKDRENLSITFPKNVLWTPIGDLTKDVIDRRTDKSVPLERFWIGYWLLAHRLLKEKKYKAVCVTQADQFTFVNLDEYFKLSENGRMVSTYYPFTNIGVDLPYGNDKAIWNRCQCGLFDSLNFVNQSHADMVIDIVNMQAEDAFKEEASHSVIALNRSVCKHRKKEEMTGLHGDEWVCDNLWGREKIAVAGNKAFMGGVQMKGWHQRWWQPGRREAELFQNSQTKDIQIHNYDTIVRFMKRFADL